MAFMDKIKNIFNVSEEDYYDDLPEDGDFEDTNEDAKEPKSVYDDYDFSSSSSSSSSSASSYSSSRPRSDDFSDKRNKVVNINATTKLQVVLVKPERFDDAPSIADHLNAKRTVVLNLESTSKDVARRLVDFLSGVAYANNGQLKRVANSTFIITPFNVDIMGDLLIDELDNSGLYI